MPAKATHSILLEMHINALLMKLVKNPQPTPFILQWLVQCFIGLGRETRGPFLLQLAPRMIAMNLLCCGVFMMVSWAYID